MLTVARIQPEQWQILKTLRLAALQEAPYALGTTYESACKRTDAEWQEMAWQRATSHDSCLYFVYREGEPVGLAGGYRETEHPDVVQLVSVWVAPDCRKTGAGQAVVEAVCAWAATVPVPMIMAYVTTTNTRALTFYHRLGFHPIEVPLADASDEHENETLLSRSLVA